MALNKIDIPDAAELAELVRPELVARGLRVFAISTKSGAGLQALTFAMAEVVAERRAQQPPAPPRAVIRPRPIGARARGDGEEFTIRREGEVWRSFVVEEEAIAIAGEPTEYLSVKRSVRGPIVSGIVPELEYWSGPPLSLRWVGLEPATGIQAALDLMCADSVAAARAALRGWVLPVNTFVLADVDGQIGLQVAGRVPQQPELLVHWIVEPASLVPGTTMPAMGVGERDARDIAAYLGGLR